MLANATNGFFGSFRAKKSGTREVHRHPLALSGAALVLLPSSALSSVRQIHSNMPTSIASTPWERFFHIFSDFSTFCACRRAEKFPFLAICGFSSFFSLFLHSVPLAAVLCRFWYGSTPFLQICDSSVNLPKGSFTYPSHPCKKRVREDLRRRGSCRT